MELTVEGELVEGSRAAGRPYFFLSTNYAIINRITRGYPSGADVTL
jgi:hypothetical protein